MYECWVLTDSILATVSNTLALKRNETKQHIAGNQFFPCSMCMCVCVFRVSFSVSISSYLFLLLCFLCYVKIFWIVCGGGDVRATPHTHTHKIPICFIISSTLLLLISIPFHMVFEKRLTLTDYFASPTIFIFLESYFLLFYSFFL